MDGFPLIFDIHHFALDDGPGIRTTVFLKGCPLSCVWCHNPESERVGPEIAFYPQLCISCGHCKTICSQHAISFENPGRIIRARCTGCGSCTEECPATALKKIGKFYSPDELSEVLLSDRIFYDTSGGGITFSGGEPTFWIDYVSEVMQQLKKNKIHVAIQTSGMFDLSEFKAKLLPFSDLIFYDIKLFDSHKHKCYTGRSNEQILNNFMELCKESVASVVATIPLVPGITATVHNLTSIAEFLKSTGCFTYEFKPYNPGGISKRIMLGKSVPPEISDKPMRIEEQERLKEIFSQQGLE
jgi:pyruvate formate lyase activating enzyme